MKCGPCMLICFSSEAKCRATSFRLNRNRNDPSVPLKTGSHHHDVIILSRADKREYLCLEASLPQASGTASTKTLSDVRKILRSMRDMLKRLYELQSAPNELVQVFGIITEGATIRIYRMVYAGGCVCLLNCECDFTIPRVLEGNLILNIIELLCMFLRLKVALPYIMLLYMLETDLSEDCYQNVYYSRQHANRNCRPQSRHPTGFGSRMGRRHPVG
jgi:hypothetical protein